MGKDTLSGITGFFDDLENGSQAPEGEPVNVQEQSVGDKPRPTHQRKRQQKPAAKPDETVSTKDTPPEQVRLPTGRRPGTKAGEGPRRTKASLWLDAELLDEYRERVYVDRLHLGELIERALRAYKRQNW